MKFPAGVLLLAAAGGMGVGCAETQHFQTARFSVAYPDNWKLKTQGPRDGEATVFVVSTYGTAVIDEGAGAMGSKASNYDAVTADVEVRLYAWPAPSTVGEPVREISRLLKGDKDLALSTHAVVLETPPECGLFRRRYTVFGASQEPLDLLRRPGWRTILVGGTSGAMLLGAVARVEFEQDMARFCHNLRNMQIQLQHVLDAVTPVPVAAPSPPPGP